MALVAPLPVDPLKSMLDPIRAHMRTGGALLNARSPEGALIGRVSAWHGSQRRRRCHLAAGGIARLRMPLAGGTVPPASRQV